MLQSLAKNKVEFVKLFIEFGVSINSILTKDHLSFLYCYAYLSDDSILRKIHPQLLSSREESGSIEILLDKDFPNNRMNLEDLKTYITEIVCANTARDDVSFFEVS